MAYGTRYFIIMWPSTVKGTVINSLFVIIINLCSVIRYKRTGGKFTDILIRNAGHMVPMDNPRVAKFMVDDFIQEYASV